ncbi:MAG: hypothetical protein PVJ53_14320, partial [Desulfobacterales bacterium]
QDCVETYRRRAVDHAGQVHPEKVQHRLEKSTNQMFDGPISLWRGLAILSPKGDELKVHRYPHHPFQAFGQQGPAGHHAADRYRHPVQWETQVLRTLIDGSLGLAGPDLPPPGFEKPGHSGCDA